MSNRIGRILVSPLMMLTMILATVHGYKILLVFPTPTPSHAILGQGYVRELLKKGHEVTFITVFPKKNAVTNLTEIDISFVLKEIPSMSSEVAKVFEGKSSSTEDFTLWVHMTTLLTQHMHKHESIQAFIHNTDINFDLVVVEWFYNELFAGLAALFQCPLVWSSSLDLHSGISRYVDVAINPSYISDSLGGDIPPFTFLQRAKNLWVLLRNIKFVESLKSENAAEYKDIYGPAAAKRGVVLPPYDELIYNASFVLLNSHPSLFGSSSNLPQNVKVIGGYHIEEPIKPLPDDLQMFMDESKHGVIYFSLGSYVNISMIPDEIKTDLLKMFKELDQIVFWKSDENLENQPKNVYIRSWFPQASILAHPNIKMFITHGGLLSTTETVHFGVPIIGVPFFGDQFLNLERAVKMGFALTVKASYNLADDLRAAIEEVLTNSSYAETAKRLSSLYHDRPLPPAEELVYWLEYAVRTGGAPHLRSAALLLPWYQRLYVDLIALIAATFLGLMVLTIYFLRLRRSKSTYSKIKSN